MVGSPACTVVSDARLAAVRWLSPLASATGGHAAPCNYSECGWAEWSPGRFGAAVIVTLVAVVFSHTVLSIRMLAVNATIAHVISLPTVGSTVPSRSCERASVCPAAVGSMVPMGARSTAGVVPVFCDSSGAVVVPGTMVGPVVESATVKCHLMSDTLSTTIVLVVARITAVSLPT